MTSAEENNAHLEISPEEAFKLTRADALHTGVKAGLSTLPVVGDIFELLIASPASKRRDAFLISLYDGLKRLEAQVEDFNLESSLENEVLQTTVIQATQAAIRTHSKEKHEALRNVVLNSAISKSPDENRQAMFIRLCDELTETHIHLLMFFNEDKAASVVLDLDHSDWRMNTALGRLGNLIEDVFPSLKRQFDFYIAVINDLHARGLIGNILPSKGMMTKTRQYPTSTAFAKEFLAFLKSPLD